MHEAVSSIPGAGAPARPRPTLRPQVRPVRHRFDAAEVPRRWYADNAAITHLANGVNLLFPAGERFFIRSVARLADRVDDPGLLADVRAFTGQEGAHTREHERFIAVLREQGYEVDEFLGEFERAMDRVEAALGPELSLATTAATEHFTALLAVGLWKKRRVLRRAPRELRHLFLWHAAEEVEHAHVAFDVFEAALAGRFRRYPTRVAGLAIATAMLGYWWRRATRMLHEQDGRTRVEVRAEVAALDALGASLGLDQERLFRDIFLRGILLYVRPGFHPSDLGTGDDFEREELAARLLAEAEADPAELERAELGTL